MQSQALRWKQENAIPPGHRKALQRAREEINHLLPFIRPEDLKKIMEIIRAYAGKNP